MPIFFFMRQDVNSCSTLKALNNIISTDGNELILSTGYVNVDFLKKRNNGFFQSFSKWFDSANDNNILKLTIVGGMIKHKKPKKEGGYKDDFFVCSNITNSGCDLCEINTKKKCNQYVFKSFVELIESWIPENKKKYINIVFARTQNNQYHAKVAIKYMEDKPIVALCGSSNLTKPALEEGYIYHNYEADMFVYTNQFKYKINIKKQLDCEDGIQDIRELKTQLYYNIKNVSQIISSLPDEKDNENQNVKKLLDSFVHNNQCYSHLLNSNNNANRAISGFLEEAKKIMVKIKEVEALSRTGTETIEYKASNEECEDLLIKISNVIQSHILLKTETMIKNSSFEYSDGWN